jgi:hypothetical protein
VDVSTAQVGDIKEEVHDEPVRQSPTPSANALPPIQDPMAAAAAAAAAAAVAETEA